MAPGAGEIGRIFGDAGLKDTITYNMSCVPPSRDDGLGTVVARMSGDSKLMNWLEYNWKFEPLGPEETKVSVTCTLRSKTLLFLPLIDSVETAIMRHFTKAFRERMAALQEESRPLRARSNSVDMHFNIADVEKSIYDDPEATSKK